MASTLRIKTKTVDKHDIKKELEPLLAIFER